ncbi:hypothetical protein [Lacticaseibacillus yichunensis]|uniref:DUF4878 domain-containing protein n=1 Tax=Lacticaseibacillus yichunensis TaxID=2486015 RepID=A0ABW4CR14_9LACO|nr:hypothetical protein [Lacticaseibacillus yichunensis]
MRKRTKLLALLLVALFMGLGLVYTFADREVVVQGMTDAQATQARRQARQVLVKNIDAVNAGSVSEYLETVPPSKRTETAAQMTKALAKRDATLKLQEFKVQKQTRTSLMAKVDQLQTTTKTGKKQILESTIEFVNQDGAWYIKKSLLVNLIKAN